MTKLSAGQSKVLKFAKTFAKREGYPPTRREISANFGWTSTNAADQQLKALASKGYIALRGVSRGIAFLK